jgi:hypothetical protein
MNDNIRGENTLGCVIILTIEQDFQVFLHRRQTGSNLDRHQHSQPAGSFGEVPDIAGVEIPARNPFRQCWSLKFDVRQVRMLAPSCAAHRSVCAPLTGYLG